MKEMQGRNFLKPTLMVGKTLCCRVANPAFGIKGRHVDSIKQIFTARFSRVTIWQKEHTFGILLVEFGINVVNCSSLCVAAMFGKATFCRHINYSQMVFAISKNQSLLVIMLNL
jgi:hypothetical protein